MSALRLALRALAKSPGFTIISLVTLALGIGVNTSMYTLIDVMLFRAIPFPEPDRVVVIRGTTPQGQQQGFSFAELEEMRAQAVGPDRAFESITTLSGWNNTWAEPGRPAERLLSMDATADFFTTFRVQPMLGRAHTADEQVPGKNQVAILGHALWQSRFGGDPNVINRTIRLNAEPVTVIGVMPPSFNFPQFFGRTDLWRPMTVPRHIVADRHNRFFFAMGRLNPGVSKAQAHARLVPLATRWEKDFPQNNKDRGFLLQEPHEAVMDDAGRLVLWFLFGLSGSVLLIACANIANLQLARATANARDLAVRSALGASRFRLILHQLTQCMLLALGGGALGVVVASWGNALLARAVRLGDSAGLELPIDLRVLTVTLLVSLLTGLLFGLLPAWIAARHDVATALKQQTRGATAGRGHHLARRALVVSEVALALALLGVAGMMIRGFESMLHRPAGWDSGRVLVANIHLPEQSTYDTGEKRRIVIEKFERRLAQIPGAEHVAVATTVPTFNYSKTSPLQIQDQTPEDPNLQPSVGYIMVSSDFFATLGIPLLEGRTFPVDVKEDGPPVVIVGETLARRFWPGASALGKRIGERHGENVVWREIIGVVRDVQLAMRLDDPPTMFQAYKPHAQEAWGYQHLIIRGPAPAAFKSEMRRAIADVDPDVAVQELYTIGEVPDRFLRNITVVNQTLGGFALLGLVLAAVGLYGVISNLVAQRTGEFGIRLALGAKPRDILALVLRAGVVLTLIGLAIGAVLACALSLVLRSEMPRVAGLDFVTLGGVAALLFVVAVFACWWPARRATKVDPVVALRAE